MDSVVIERDISRAGRTAATLVALDRSDAIVDTIRAHRILGLLPERDLLALLRQSSTRSLPKNRVLFRFGDEGRSVVLILQGYVKLSAMAPNGREVVLEIAGPGSIFGELAVLNGSPRQADATTLTSCRVMAIDGALFRRSLAATPEAMFAAIRLLADRLSAVTRGRWTRCRCPRRCGWRRLCCVWRSCVRIASAAVCRSVCDCRSASLAR